MVCPRCITAVRSLLAEISVEVVELRLGSVQTKDRLTSDQLKVFSDQLQGLGFALLEDRQAQLISMIKSIIITQIHYAPVPLTENLSTFLAKKLGYDYAYLSRQFSALEGLTIEKFATRQRIEKAKELLIYDELSVAQIADRLGYNSGALSIRSV